MHTSRSDIKMPRSGWLWLLIAMLASGLALSPVLNADWVNWDDPEYVTQNTSIRDFSVGGLAALFKPENRALDTYAPLTQLSFAIDYAIAGNDASWYHGVNLLLHLLCVALVFLLVQRLTADVRVAFFVAVLFGLHPLHVESVAWVTERKDVLFSIFFLGACLAYLRGRNRHPETVISGTGYWLAIVFGALAMLAKPQAVTLPAALLLLDYWRNGTLQLRDLKRTAPFWLLSLGTGLLALGIMDANPSEYSLLERIGFSGHAAWTYLWKALVPINLLHDMGRPDAGAMPALYYASTATMLGLLAAGLWFGRRHRVVIVGLGWFVVNLSVALHFLKINSGVAYDRFTYLPYIGLFLIAGVGLNWLVTRYQRSKYGVYGLVVVVIITFGVMANQRARIWENDGTLWADAAEQRPDHPTAWCKRASYFAAQGNYAQAFVDQDKCISLNGDRSEVWSNRGNLYRNTGNTFAALQDYEKAIVLDPENALPFVNRGILYMQVGEAGKGLADLEQAVQLEPENSAFYLNLGLGYEMAKQTESALKTYSTGIKLDEANYLAWKYRGSLLLVTGQFEAALADLLHATALEPDYGEGWHLMGRALEGLERTTEAEKAFERANSLGFVQ